MDRPAARQSPPRGDWRGRRGLDHRRRRQASPVDALGLGKNLQEHVSYHGSFLVDTPTYNSRMRPLNLAAEMVQYPVRGRGLMTIMPVMPAANTHAPSIMVGEKAAAMIVEDAA